MMELPFAFARKHQLVLTQGQANNACLLFTSQTPIESFSEVQRLLNGEPFDLKKVSESELEKELQTRYSNSEKTSIDNLENFGLDSLESAAEQASEAEDLLDSNDEAPIIRLLNAILAEAIRSNASDIHIEPFENQLRIRFRMDGQLKTVLTPKKNLAEMLTSRIKVMAKLDIAEKRLPQDGRIATKLGGRAVDLRISTIPSSFGERVVMRLLDKTSGRLNLHELGLPETQFQQLQKLLQLPHGILLVTGPTGSGKTTTLYAALSRLNDTQRNIMTIEDPVEYNIEGINQMQVNAKTELTFAKGLRAILRQDPDIIMVGEIRDFETGQIAVQSSLTGHLVLSTLHTNTAIGAISRLRDMGVEPFLVASSLHGVMAQRLVRRLCEHCKTPHTLDETEANILGIVQGEIYKPVGCDTCHHTGYQGRIGIYELIVVDDHLRQLIHQNASEAEMDTYVHQTMPPINQSGFELVLAGKTSLEEVLRVIEQ